MAIDTMALQAFIAVSETGSFTKAASRVGRTQSAISQQVSRLEDLLGKNLIVRGKHCCLTNDGEIFLSYARQIFALHCEVMDRFRKPDLEGEVRFGLPENFASLYLSTVLADFSRIHPRILLHIECDLTLNLFERFKKKEFDLVIVKMNHPEDFPNGLNVWSEPLKWVGDATLLDPLKPVPLVLAPQPCVYRSSALSALEKRSLAWRLVFTSPSHTSTCAAVRAGMGLTVMPERMVPHDLSVLESPLLPQLADTHVSILKHKADNAAVNSLESFVLRELRNSRN